MGFMGYQGQDERIGEDSETGDTDHNNRLGRQRSSYTRKVTRKWKKKASICAFIFAKSRKPIARMSRDFCTRRYLWSVCRHENSTPRKEQTSLFCVTTRQFRHEIKCSTHISVSRSA